MSIVIQKKRLSEKRALLDAKNVQVQDHPISHHQQYTKLFVEFEANFSKSFYQGDLRRINHLLDSFYRKLKCDEHLITDLSKQDDSIVKNSDDLALTQKANQLVIFLADYMVNKRNSILERQTTFDLLDKLTSESRDATITIIKILKLFSMINPNFATALSNWPGFTDTLFTLISQDSKLYFKQILLILEALLASNAATIHKDMYPLILEILSTLPKKYFARFSRIIALFVLENSEKMDFKDLPVDFVPNKMVKIHSFLFSIPELIESYISILVNLKDIIVNLTSANLQTFHKIIHQLKESRAIKDSGLNLSFLKPLFEKCQISENLLSEVFTLKFIVKFIVKKSNITEILFIISNFLAGKRKIDVQDQLRKLNFFERVINPFFDIFFHPTLELESNDDIQNGGHQNNPLTTTRIQLLRIIINFCDRDSSNLLNKDLLISAEEKAILENDLIQVGLHVHQSPYTNSVQDKSEFSKALNQMAFHPSSSSRPFFTEAILTQNAFENVENKGLLNKVIRLLRSVPANSSYHFWFSSCIESFLRGFTPSHQIFVAHSGLLHSLLDQILSNQISKSNNIQISYDLIGEIIKFNKYNLIFLENLCSKFGWKDLLPQNLTQNLVDSNVFLRSMFLSFEKFATLADQEDDDVIRRRMLILNETVTLFDDFPTEGLKWFNLLVDTVQPGVINQDNICCINTALIFALFADQKGGLQAYLNSLLDQQRHKEKPVLEVLNNFKKVLAIWQQYYLSKTKDCFSLQHTTSIKFAYFQDIKNKIQAFLDKNIASLSQE